MGTRINYHIGILPSAILFSNSNHHSENPEEIFRRKVAHHGAKVSDLVLDLLKTTYQSSSGNHYVGQRMFTVDLEPGDHEMVLVADYSAGAQPVIREQLPTF